MLASIGHHTFFVRVQRAGGRPISNSNSVTVRGLHRIEESP